MRERRDRVRYQQWIRQGLIEATPGEANDNEDIRRKIGGKQYDIRTIAIDLWNATQFASPAGSRVDFAGADFHSCVRLAALLGVSLVESGKNVLPEARAPAG